MADAAPDAWIDWRNTGRRRRLIAERSIEWRTREEQFPSSRSDVSLPTTITDYFAGRPHDFEHCAIEISTIMLPDIATVEVTAPNRDGGRDAVGRYRLGTGSSSILVDFAIEAKCFTPPTGVGVRHLSRLISRLRHRQSGVLVNNHLARSAGIQRACRG